MGAPSRAVLRFGLVFCLPAGWGSLSMTNQVSLSAELSVTPRQLEIKYTAKNAGAKEVYLADVQFFPDSGGFRLGSAVPVVERAAEELVVLSRKLSPWPPGTTWTTPPRVYASRLGPGETRRDLISIAVPLRPAGLAPRQNLREIVCRRARFVLGVITSDPALDPRKEVFDGRTVWSLSAAALGHQQEVAVESEVSLPVRVLTQAGMPVLLNLGLFARCEDPAALAGGVGSPAWIAPH